MRKITFLFFLGCFVMNAECLGKSSVDANSINALVTGNNDFVFDLYGKLTDDSKGNLFFSPYSISTSLAMTYGGPEEIPRSKWRMFCTLRCLMNDSIQHLAICIQTHFKKILTISP
jgi:serine protease inhibitor